MAGGGQPAAGGERLGHGLGPSRSAGRGEGGDLVRRHGVAGGRERPRGTRGVAAVAGRPGNLSDHRPVSGVRPVEVAAPVAGWIQPRGRTDLPAGRSGDPGPGGPGPAEVRSTVRAGQAHPPARGRGRLPAAPAGGLRAPGSPGGGVADSAGVGASKAGPPGGGRTGRSVGRSPARRVARARSRPLCRSANPRWGHSPGVPAVRRPTAPKHVEEVSLSVWRILAVIALSASVSAGSSGPASAAEPPPARPSPGGAAARFSTYLGGTSYEEELATTTDSAGDVYVVGD